MQSPQNSKTVNIGARLRQPSFTSVQNAPHSQVPPKSYPNLSQPTKGRMRVPTAPRNSNFSPSYFRFTNQSPTRQPAYLNDPSLHGLLSQLGRVNASIRIHEDLQRRIADEEEQFKRDLAARLAKSLVSASAATASNNTGGKNNNSGGTSTTHAEKDQGSDDWMVCFDDQVGAEYYYNVQTGEASWVDPRQTA